MTTSLPSASVVIPTYNRLSDLRRVVNAVRNQSVAGACDLELMVVDDGSSDGTAAWLEIEQSRGDLTVITQANAGPAAARNRGARSAGREVLLFLGDDTQPAPGWLQAHLEEHRLHGPGEAPLAVVGYTGFPSAEDGPFLRFINEQGAQFGYQLIEDPQRVPFNFFYTSNVSLPRSFFLGLGGFREDFSAAAWEDIEFAYRACALGLRSTTDQPPAPLTTTVSGRGRSVSGRGRRAGPPPCSHDSIRSSRTSSVFHGPEPAAGQAGSNGRCCEPRSRSAS